MVRTRAAVVAARRGAAGAVAKSRSTSSRARAAAPRPRPRRASGQSLAEFAIILPLLLAMVGLTIDIARLFQAWMKVQTVTRDAAEFIATDATIETQADARARAEELVCVGLTGATGCLVGTSAITLVDPTFGETDDFYATSSGEPIAGVRVTVEQQWDSIFIWPIIGGLTGDRQVTLASSVFFEVWRGRL